MSRQKDFENFSGEAVLPPASVSHRIVEAVRVDLNPSAYAIFLKLLGIHVLTSLLTLSVCPQFEFRLLGEGMGLMHVFMVFGRYGCIVACGAFFTGSSLLIATVFLRGEELRKIRHNRLLGLGALALLSLGFFFMLDSSLVLSIASAWLVGAILGSLLTLELGWTLRFGNSS